MPAGLGTLTIGSTKYRAYDYDGTSLWLPVHILADSTGNPIDPTNPLSVGSAYPVSVSGTIANGGSLSGAVDMGRSTLSAIIFPAAWTAASLTFQFSADNSTYVDLLDGTTERTLTVTAGKGTVVSISDWPSARYLKLRSGTSATPVNQGAARTFTLIGVL